MARPTEQIGTVAMLARYPVKSMRGERLERAELHSEGIAGDRRWAVYTPDGGIGSGKTTRRFRRVAGLLDYRAGLDDGPVPTVEFPDGERWPADDPLAAERLSAQLGRPLQLAEEDAVPHKDASPLHLISTATLRALERLLGEPAAVDRFRANLLLEVPGTGFVEDGWVGRELRLGDEAVLRVGGGMPRCVMVDLAQGALGPDGRILKLLGRERDLLLGAMVEVVRPGTVRVGDPAVLA